MAAQVSRVEEIQINGNTYLTSSVAICFSCAMLRWCHANTSFLYVGTPSTHSSHLHAMYICTMFLHNRFYHNFPFMHEFVLKFYWSVRHSRVAPPSTATNSPAAAEQHLSDSAYVFVLYSSEIYSGRWMRWGECKLEQDFRKPLPLDFQSNLNLAVRLPLWAPSIPLLIHPPSQLRLCFSHYFLSISHQIWRQEEEHRHTVFAPLSVKGIYVFLLNLNWNYLREKS